jgi:hypothetical protein
LWNLGRQLEAIVEIATNTQKYVCRGKELSATKREKYENTMHRKSVNKYKVTMWRTHNKK